MTHGVRESEGGAVCRGSYLASRRQRARGFEPCLCRWSLFYTRVSSLPPPPPPLRFFPLPPPPPLDFLPSLLHWWFFFRPWLYWPPPPPQLLSVSAILFPLIRYQRLVSFHWKYFVFRFTPMIFLPLGLTINHISRLFNTSDFLLPLLAERRGVVDRFRPWYHFVLSLSPPPSLCLSVSLFKELRERLYSYYCHGCVNHKLWSLAHDFLFVDSLKFWTRALCRCDLDNSLSLSSLCSLSLSSHTQQTSHLLLQSRHSLVPEFQTRIPVTNKAFNHLGVFKDSRPSHSNNKHAQGYDHVSHRSPPSVPLTTGERGREPTR